MKFRQMLIFLVKLFMLLVRDMSVNFTFEYIHVLSYYITSSSNFTMLHNVNLNFVNLNTLTLCLSICNRMAPPTKHQLYPILEVEYDDQHRAHILSDNDVEVALPTLRPRTHTSAH